MVWVCVKFVLSNIKLILLCFDISKWNWCCSCLQHAMAIDVSVCVLLWQLERHFRVAVMSQTIFLFWDHLECFHHLKEVVQLATVVVAFQALEALKEKDHSKKVCICDCNDVDILNFEFRYGITICLELSLEVYGICLSIIRSIWQKNPIENFCTEFPPFKFWSMDSNFSLWQSHRCISNFIGVL